MLSDEWLPRYRLLENFNIKLNGNGNAHGNGNAYDRGDYNSSFALRAVELKMDVYPCFIGIVCVLRHIDFRFGVAKRQCLNFILSLWEFFFKRSRAANSAVLSRIWLKFKLL